MLTNQPDQELENNHPDTDLKDIVPKPEDEDNPPDPELENKTGYDPKNREVILSGKKGSFKVEKPRIGFVKKNIKSKAKALEIFYEQVNSTQN
jgi:hypothetical protein